MFSLWCSSWRLLGSPGIFILKNPRSSFKSSCNTPYVIMQSPTTGISFQHLELLLFPPLLVRILEETLNSSDLADEDKSGCQAWNFYEEKKQQQQHYKHFWPHISRKSSRVAALIQDLPTQPLNVNDGSQGFWKTTSWTLVVKTSCFFAPDTCDCTFYVTDNKMWK